MYVEALDEVATINRIKAFFVILPLWAIYPKIGFSVKSSQCIEEDFRRNSTIELKNINNNFTWLAR